MFSKWVRNKYYLSKAFTFSSKGNLSIRGKDCVKVKFSSLLQYFVNFFLNNSIN